MAKMYKLEESVELKCSATKIFEMLRAKQPEIAQLCSHKIPTVQAHQGDWLNVGSTRKWDLIIDEKSSHIVDRIEKIDEKNMTLTRSVIEGDVMKHYKTLTVHVQAIAKGDGDSCLLKVSLEYEKTEEDAPEPHEFLNFGVDVLKEVAQHLSAAN